MDKQQKLAVLAKLGRALNEAQVTWAIGASLMLYLNGKVDDFHDIDLTTTVEDAPRVTDILLRLGTMLPTKSSAQFQTKCFAHFMVEGVDVDMLAGFAIVCDGVTHDCSLTKASITSFAEVDGERIPLQSMEEWKSYYRWMGRPEKAALI